MNRSLHRLLRRYVLTGSFRRQKTSAREYESGRLGKVMMPAELTATTSFFASARPSGVIEFESALSSTQVSKLMRDWRSKCQAMSGSQLLYENGAVDQTRLYDEWTNHWLDTPWWAFWR